MLDFATQKTILDPILKNPKNHKCADCDTISPTWASLDFGVFLCSNCSGAHRALGPTITRVRSANLDKWNSEWINNMLLGNTQLNSYWESDPHAIGRKPKMGANLDVIARYVFEKYVKRKFVLDPSVADPLTSYKNGTYQNSKEQQTKAAYEDPKVQTPPNVAKQLTKPSRIQTPPVKADVCLLQFDFQPKSTPVQPAQPIASNPTFSQQVFQQNCINPQIIHNTEEQDQFTDFAQAGSLKNQQEKIDSFVSFDTLLTQQKQIKSQQPPQNSYSSYNGIKSQNINIHHPYNPMIGQHNLVYNSHYSNQPHQYSQFNNYHQQPQYSQHMHHHHQNAQSGLNFGIGYHNQAVVTPTVNQYWK